MKEKLPNKFTTIHSLGVSVGTSGFQPVSFISLFSLSLLFVVYRNEWESQSGKKQRMMVMEHYQAFQSTQWGQISLQPDSPCI